MKAPSRASSAAPMRSGKMYPDPLHYDHLWPSMRRFAQFLALRYDSLRTRHSYYRQLRLLCDHFDGADPALVTEEMLRAYLLHVKTVRLWQPKTMRQALATARTFFIGMLGRGRWRVFDEVKTKDHDSLPPVLTREQVRALLQSIHRSVISDSRILAISDTHVTFRHLDRSDRAKPVERTLTVSGVEFVRRYLRHVQPAKLRAVRYYGYHHPAAKKTRQRVQQSSGQTPTTQAAKSEAATESKEPGTKNGLPKCPCCQQPLVIIARIQPGWKRGALWQPQQSRAPPNQPQGASRA